MWSQYGRLIDHPCASPKSFRLATWPWTVAVSLPSVVAVHEYQIRRLEILPFYAWRFRAVLGRRSD